jgi:hypothetical protein
MASGFKINGVDLDEIFRVDGSERILDAESTLDEYNAADGQPLNQRYLKAGETDPETDPGNVFPFKADGASLQTLIQDYKPGTGPGDPIEDLKEDPLVYLTASINIVSAGSEVEAQVLASGTTFFDSSDWIPLTTAQYQYYNGASWVNIGSEAAV